MNKLKRGTILATLIAAVVAGSVAAAPVTLRASHQFPGGKGDVRDDMVQMIAREAKAAGVDLDVQVYPGASLFKPVEQWNAIVNGQLDIALLPLDYASGKVPAFSATLMPGLVRSYDRAQRLNESQFMKDIHAKIESAGAIVLSDAWFGGGMASKKGCIVNPDDVKGLKFRSAGPDVRANVADGGGDDRFHTVERNLQRLPERRRRGDRHEHGQLSLLPSVRTGEVPDRSRQERPVVHVRAGADVQEKLRQTRQEAAGSAAQGRQERAEVLRRQGGIGRRSDHQGLQDHNVTIKSLSDDEYNRWIDVASKSSYLEFAKDVPDGKKLIDEALSVK